MIEKLKIRFLQLSNLLCSVFGVLLFFDEPPRPVAATVIFVPGILLFLWGQWLIKKCKL